MSKTQPVRSMDELEPLFLAYMEEYPERADALGLWMADAETLEATDPESAAIFAELFPELRG